MSDIREDLQALVAGNWEPDGNGWTVDLGGGWALDCAVAYSDELSAEPDEAMAVLRRKTGFDLFGEVPTPDAAGAVRALLTGKDAALVIGILAHAKALPWREEPDPELGKWWWRACDDEMRLVCVERADDVEVDWVDAAEYLGPEIPAWTPVQADEGYRWRLACPPPSPPEGPNG